MKKLISCMVISTLLAGCASAPRNLTVIERGAKPDLQVALAMVHERLKRTLKDYDSMKDFAVVRGEIYPISAANLAYDFEEAWMLCVEYNAKNSYGGYTGLKQHGFPLRLDSNNQPMFVSTTNWRTYTNGNCS